MVSCPVCKAMGVFVYLAFGPDPLYVGCCYSLLLSDFKILGNAVVFAYGMGDLYVDYDFCDPDPLLSKIRNTETEKVFFL